LPLGALSRFYSACIAVIKAKGGNDKLIQHIEAELLEMDSLADKTANAGGLVWVQPQIWILSKSEQVDAQIPWTRTKCLHPEALKLGDRVIDLAGSVLEDLGIKREDLPFFKMTDSKCDRHRAGRH
jgi:hypothetical protein